MIYSFLELIFYVNWWSKKSFEKKNKKVKTKSKYQERTYNYDWGMKSNQFY